MRKKIFEFLAWSPFSKFKELRDMVRESLHRLKIDPKIIDEVVTIVDEGISNIIEHAYSSKNGPFKTKILLENNFLKIEFEDKGKPFTFDQEQDFSEEKIIERERGFGLYLIHKLSDRYEYKKKGHRNIKRFWKKIKTDDEQPV